MPDNLSLLHLAHRLQQICTECFSKVYKGSLTARQMVLLQALAATPGVSQTILVEATGIDRSTVAEIVKRLLRDNLVKRRRSRMDSRAYVLHVTDEGQKELEAAVPAAALVDAKMLEGLPAQERESFIRTLAWLTSIEREPLSSKVT
ncbi:MAG: winged helix-turn-helix transcriptional regulator, partial [Proteobacteria bacterium]|nr:winged helix-turn-helix transcriptional regulator [Pseudomonadota bacterium]